MKHEQEPKYSAVASDDGETRIFNRASGELIPDDEPVFILRARDKWAGGIIWEYAQRVENEEHRQVVMERVEDFKRFADKHPDRMHEPTTRREDLGA